MLLLLLVDVAGGRYGMSSSLRSSPAPRGRTGPPPPASTRPPVVGPSRLLFDPWLACLMGGSRGERQKQASPRHILEREAQPAVGSVAALARAPSASRCILKRKKIELKNRKASPGQMRVAARSIDRSMKAWQAKATAAITDWWSEANALLCFFWGLSSI